jgi:hypothetical protein
MNRSTIRANHMVHRMCRTYDMTAVFTNILARPALINVHAVCGKYLYGVYPGLEAVTCLECIAQEK